MAFRLRKEPLVFALAVAAVLANAALSFWNLHRLVAVQREVNRSHELLAELSRLDATLRDAESAQLRFLTTDGRSSLAPFEAASTVLSIRLDRLVDLIDGESAQTTRVGDLARAARRQLDDLADGIRLFRSGHRDEAVSRATGASSGAEGSPVRSAVERVEDAERQALAVRDAEARRRRFVASFSGVVSTLLGLGLLAVAFVLLRAEREAQARAAEALERANSWLRDADRRKDEFLVSLAHELRNPLGAMRTAVELLASAEEPDDGRAAGRRALARTVLSRQLANLTRLVDDLLDLSRVTSRKIVLSKEPLPLTEVVDAALETTRPALDARGLELRRRLPEESVFVEGDAVRLAQVVSNLLSNAARYCPEGGHVDLEIAADEVEAVLRVTDDGIGLAPEDLERVFGLFEQVPSTTKAQAGDGLGVGLALARRIAQLHGGSLTASSPGPGKGSTFTLRLPRAAAPGAAAPAPLLPVQRRPAAEPRRVLVVDDDVDGARALAELLTISGHEVELASDGPSALEAARRSLPDAVVLDLGLPGLDGYEVARRIRAEESLAGTLLVALSGWAGLADRLRSAEAGIDHHLVKPVGPGVLEELLATATRRPRT